MAPPRCTRVVGLLALAGAALSGAGCGRRLVGYLPGDGGGPATVPPQDGGDAPGPESLPPPQDGGDGPGPEGLPKVVPGQVLWAVAGWPTSDATGTLYTTARHGETATFWRIDDKEMGLLGWHDFGMFLCFGGGGTAVLRDLYARGLLRGVASDTGALRWSINTQAYISVCVPEADRVLLVQSDPGGPPTFSVHRASDGVPAWQVTLPNQTGLLQGTDADTVYLSTSANNDVTLTALRLADGQMRWAATYPSSYLTTLALEAAGEIYAVDGSAQTPSVARISPANGAIMWRQPGTGYGQFLTAVVRGSGAFIAVQDQQDLIARDKATGDELWRYPANSGSLWQSWEAEFTKSGDLIVTGYRTTAVDGGSTLVTTTMHAVVSAAGRELWRVGPTDEVQESVSTLRRYLWETGSGELYSTAGGSVARLDPATGRPIWTSPVTSVARVLGSDDSLVLTAGPLRGCCFIDEWVQALDARDGSLRWQMSRRLTGPIALFGEDETRFYFVGAPSGMYEPETTAAVAK